MVTKGSLADDLMKKNKNEVAKSMIDVDQTNLKFLGKSVKVRLIYPNSEVVTYDVKINSHTFSIGDREYFFHPDAFYRIKKMFYCDYYFNNPCPIKYKHEFRGIPVAGTNLKQMFKRKTFKDKKGETISYEDWETLPYEDKLLFPEVIEFDGRMINKIVNYRFVEDMFQKDGLLDGNKKWILIGLILVGLVVAYLFQSGAI